MVASWTDVWWLLSGVGLLAGFLSGLFGVGGGIVMVPALVLVLSLPQRAAQGISLAVIVPVAILGAYRYWREPQLALNFGVVALLAGGALLGTLVGVSVALRLPDQILRRLFAVFLVVVAVRMLLPSGRS